MVFTILIYSLGLGIMSAYGSDRMPVPSVTNDPDHVTVEEGQTAVLPCSVNNLGTKTVTWRKSQDEVPLSISRTVYIPDARFSLDNNLNWDLRITNVAISDGGLYVCQVTGVTVMKGMVTLVVTHKQVKSTTLSEPEHAQSSSQPPTMLTTYVHGPTTLLNDHAERTPPRSKISREMLRSAELEFYREHILTDKLRREVMNKELVLYEAKEKFEQKKNKTNSEIS